MGHIYKITNQITNKSYIGYTENPDVRWTDHKQKKGSKLVYQAIKKYGLENITFEVIAEDIIANEDDYIQKYNTLAPNGYNLTSGGGLPPNHKGKSYEDIYGDKANEQRLKRTITQLQRGGYGPVKHTEETKKKISKSTSGENNGMFGRTHSENTRKKISEAKKGKNVGANNPTAKKWKLTSPEGIEYHAHGNLRKKCQELGISYSTIHAAHLYKRSMKSGWKIEEL